MSYFSIKTKEIKTLAGTEQTIARRVGNCADELNGVRSQIRSRIKSLSGVDSALAELVRQINDYENKIIYCKFALEDSAENYERTERLLCLGLPAGFIKFLGKTDVSAILLIADKLKSVDKVLFGEGEIDIHGFPIKYDNSREKPKISVDYADYIKRKAEIEDREMTAWEKFWSDGYKGSYKSGEKAVAGTILGLDAGASVSGALLNYYTGGSAKAECDFEKGNVGAKAKAEAKVSVAKGEAKANWGDIASVNAKGSVGNAAASGEVSATLYKDGKLDPSIMAKASAAANVASGSVSAKLGDKNLGVSGEASGEVLGASADASAGIGKVEYTDASGNKVSGYGVQAKAGAEAYLAKGELKGGFDLFGHHVDLSVQGKAGGAGVNAGITATTGAVSGEIGAGLLLGLGLKFNVYKSSN